MVATGCERNATRRIEQAVQVGFDGLWRRAEGSKEKMSANISIQDFGVGQKLLENLILM